VKSHIHDLPPPVGFFGQTEIAKLEFHGDEVAFPAVYFPLCYFEEPVKTGRKALRKCACSRTKG
jgi:hypothetical protein